MMKNSPQDSAEWARVSPYLDQALELEPRERAAWVQNLALTRPDIAKFVGELLAEQAELDARGFLSRPALPETRLETFMPLLEQMLRPNAGVESGDWLREKPGQLRSMVADELAGLSAGTVVGNYRLLREIGSGGMSWVWLAERSDGLLKREVALKLSCEGPRRVQFAERFDRERNILASLTHPNIARLYDAGGSASGLSYFAMEYVPGTMLTQYCDNARLAVQDRLGIFLQVLSAVEFAHTHLVLHRDLKPSNILVTQQGRVVLLDFGIAKLLAPEIDPAAPPTEMQSRILTPDYASPEHIAGEVLGTTSDIYSLGVVLYELLCGVRPFGMTEGSRRALEDAVLTKDAPRLTQVEPTNEVALARRTTPRRLMRILGGDLDTIVRKALKKRPADRYRSVSAFVQDINNYLHNMPVSARPDSLGYRFGRLVARYKLQFAAVSVTLLAIVGGGLTAAWQARVAEAQAQLAAKERDTAIALASRNGAISDFMNLLISESASSEKPVTVSELLVRSEKLAMANSRENSDDRAAILSEIGNLILRTTGDKGTALRMIDRAMELTRDSRDSSLRSELTCAHAVIAAENTQQVEAAKLAIDRELAKPGLDPATATSCLHDLTHIAEITRDAPGALRYATAALARFREAPRQPLMDEGMLLRGVANAHSLNGDNLHADREFAQALEKYTAAGRERSPYASILINSWANMSTSAGVPRRALELLDIALDAVTEGDANARPAPLLIHNRARALEQLGRFSDARTAYEWCLQLARDSESRDAEAFCVLGLAAIAEVSGDRDGAQKRLREMGTLVDSSWPPDHLARVRRLILEGQIDLDDGNGAAALPKFEQVLTRKGVNATKVTALLGKAEALLLSGDAAGAEKESQSAMDMAITLQGGLPYSNRAGLASLQLGRALQARGEAAVAHKAFESAVKHLENTVDANHPDLVRARQLLASAGNL